MQIIELQNIPNQEFSVTIDGNAWFIQLRTMRSGATFASVTLNNELLINNILLTPNAPLLPYPYISNGKNFYMLCDNDDYPNFEKFNVTQRLVYATDEELTA